MQLKSLAAGIPRGFKSSVETSLADSQWVQVPNPIKGKIGESPNLPRVSRLGNYGNSSYRPEAED